MTDFILKSTIGMGILLAIYYLLLEREKMHRFNRFYLLFSLAFALILPFITIPVYVEATPVSAEIPVVSGTMAAVAIPVARPEINYWPYVLWSLYVLVSLALATRFTKNILHFYKLKKNNNPIRYNGATLVLLDKKVLPHTFLNNIFLNRNDYENRRIEPELLTHELAHVKQQHTLDILFIEALKIFFWFNPLLYLY